ncbi:MAG TPA: hypothetical protein VNZ58_00960 [Thermomicrobiales bacterium]|nr:hypothetical protein [Thermomicrobiales bacterium]
MHTQEEPVIQPEWQIRPETPPSEVNRWLSRVQRFAFVRAHISIFAVGSVALLALNLLANPSHVRVDRWIAAWALIVVIHGLIAGMASLALQLLADDDIRPASEVRWESFRSWALRTPAPEWPDPPPAPTTEPENDSWPEPQAPPPPDDDRVSWQAASDAAWLATPDRDDKDTPAGDSGTS